MRAVEQEGPQECLPAARAESVSVTLISDDNLLLAPISQWQAVVHMPIVVESSSALSLLLARVCLLPAPPRGDTVSGYGANSQNQSVPLHVSIH